jgi:hypothetical protein
MPHCQNQLMSSVLLFNCTLCRVGITPNQMVIGNLAFSC